MAQPRCPNINNISTPIQAMLGALHTCSLSHALPVARKALAQVRNFQRHAQTDLAQFGMIVGHERHDLVTLFRGEVVVLEQVTLAENLSDAQDLVARGVQGQV